MKLIVGLGNPGKKYDKTRHNLGFRIIDTLGTVPNRKFTHNLGLSQKTVVFFKPQKFMNLSGPEVLKKLNYFRLKPEDLIVIYDDIDLPFGEVRVRHKGRSGGHKGVQSIIDALGTENFTRVRIGIGRPPQEKSAEEYVLEEFSEDEEKNLPKTIDEAVEKVIELIKK